MIPQPNLTPSSQNQFFCHFFLLLPPILFQPLSIETLVPCWPPSSYLPQDSMPCPMMFSCLCFPHPAPLSMCISSIFPVLYICFHYSSQLIKCLAVHVSRYSAALLSALEVGTTLSYVRVYPQAQDSILPMAGTQKYVLNESVGRNTSLRKQFCLHSLHCYQGLLASWLFSIPLLLPGCPLSQWLPRANGLSKKDQV